jgi:hypothetical protein
MDEGPVGRATFLPGWRWSEHVKPIAKTESCQAPHICYFISGRMKVVMNDGEEMDYGPGDFGTIPPGHDAWIVGDEPCVVIDWQVTAAGKAGTFLGSGHSRCPLLRAGGAFDDQSRRPGDGDDLPADPNAPPPERGGVGGAFCTSGRWSVKQGHEEAFARAFAESGVNDVDPPIHVLLQRPRPLRDLSQPRSYLIARMKEHLDDMQISTLELVLGPGPGLGLTEIGLDS